MKLNSKLKQWKEKRLCRKTRPHPACGHPLPKGLTYEHT